MHISGIFISESGMLHPRVLCSLERYIFPNWFQNSQFGTLHINIHALLRGFSSDIASSYFFRPSKVTEHVTSRVSGGEFKNN